MSETPITPAEPDIPDTMPTGPEGPEPETADEPLGVPDEAEPGEAPAPGLPEREPPQAD